MIGANSLKNRFMKENTIDINIIITKKAFTKVLFKNENLKLRSMTKLTIISTEKAINNLPAHGCQTNT
mgnify:CR=1 FL=1